MRLYHLVPEAVWLEAARSGNYSPTSLHAEGFIHLSTAEQVADTFERYFAEVDDVWLVTVDEEVLEAPLRWETSPDGRGPFPHLYGPLDPSLVISAEPWTGALS